MTNTYKRGYNETNGHFTLENDYEGFSVYDDGYVISLTMENDEPTVTYENENGEVVKCHLDEYESQGFRVR